jgi:hypothetical protein
MEYILRKERRRFPGGWASRDMTELERQRWVCERLDV